MDIAIAKGVLKSKTVIVDFTHTVSYYNCKSPKEVLMNYTKNIRKQIYQINEALIDIMPKKPNDNISLKKYMNYCSELCIFVNNNEILKFYMELQKRANYLKEIVDNNLADLVLSKETEAKVGHKTVDTKFYGYKTHLAISEE